MARHDLLWRYSRLGEDGLIWVGPGPVLYLCSGSDGWYFDEVIEHETLTVAVCDLLQVLLYIGGHRLVTQVQLVLCKDKMKLRNNF